MTKRRKTFSVLTVVGILLIGGVSMFLLTSFKAEAAKVESPKEVRTVRTIELTAESQDIAVVADGFLESSRVLEIQSPLAGKVVQTASDLKGGTEVAKDDILISLDNRRALVAYQSARTEMIRVSSQFLTAAGLGDADRAAWNTFIAELNNADAGSLPVPPMNSDRQKLLASTMGVVGAWHSLEAAALDLADHNVRAPFAGTITGQGLPVGSWVSPGQPLAVLMDTRNMELRLSVSSDKLRDIAPGDPVRVSRPGDSRPGRGEVVRIEPVLRAGSQTAMVHVSMESDGDWLPGTFVTAEIEGRRIESAIRVPRGALVDGRLPVYDEGKLALLPVTVLAQDASDVLLAPNLPDGTQMVTTVLQNPIPGLSLRLEEDS